MASELANLPPQLLAAYYRDPRLALAQALREQGSDTSPVLSHTQGIARMLQGGLGGFQSSQINSEFAGRGKSYQDALAKVLAGKTPDEMLTAARESGNPDLAPFMQHLALQQAQSRAEMEKARFAESLKSHVVPEGGMYIPGQGMGGPTSAAPPQAPPQMGGIGAQIAGIENGTGNPAARNPNSSAMGNGQFIDSTWLDVAGRHGQRAGIPPQLIQAAQAGNPQARQQLLAMRADPQLAGVMTDAYASENSASLAGAGRKNISPGDLYMAHFLGPQGAQRFLAANDQNPNVPAVQVVSPEAVQANRNVFFDQSGRPRTVGEIHAQFSRKMGGGQVAQGGQGLPPGAPPNAVINPRRPEAPIFQDRPMTGDRIQRQQSRDLGQTWEPFGEPYDRREPFMIQEVRDPDGTVRQVAIPRASIGQAVQTQQGQSSTPGQPPGSVTLSTKPPTYTDAQNKEYSYGSRMTQAHQILDGLAAEGWQPDTGGQVVSKLPGGNLVATTNRQKFSQAQRNFINASLRRESGAVISDKEFENAELQYFPQPGDGPEVLEQKRQNRLLQIQTFMTGSGRKDPATVPGQKPPAAPDNPWASKSDQEVLDELRKQGLIK